MSTAFIFPGQGAQVVGMGKDFYEKYEESRGIFDKASELLGFDMKELCFENEKDINITEYTQPALLTVSVAILRVLEQKGIRPDVCAGLSLGEYCAMVASEVMSFEDAVKTVRQRGILMQEAVPLGVGAMCAVLGLDGETVNKVCQGISSVYSLSCFGKELCVLLCMFTSANYQRKIYCCHDFFQHSNELFGRFVCTVRISAIHTEA